MANPSPAPADLHDSVWTAIFAVTLILGLPALMLTVGILHI